MESYRIFFGDIHSHNALGYGCGSLERSVAIAREHLDFFAFTGHAAWHDLTPLEGGRHDHWLAGFERHAKAWPEIQAVAARENRPGEFVQFLGYEWHSSRYGDHCVVFPADHRPLHLPDHVEELRRFCRVEQALMIPHHIAYPTRHRGVNWEVFVPGSTTPVVEIHSEHGNSEHDRGPFPYSRHSMGGRVTANTVRHALGQGRRFGFVASSDNHRGFPGAYGEGLVAVLASRLTRASILEAMRARRTYALTGDRMRLDVTANEQPMGAVLDPDAKAVNLAYAIEARDELDRVELIAGPGVVHRLFPAATAAAGPAFTSPVQLRLEWGWGPWQDLALNRICDWEFQVRVHDGRLLNTFPALQSGPFSEQRRHRIRRCGPGEVSVVSYTGREDAFAERATQNLILELEGHAATEVEVSLSKPAAPVWRLRLDRLLASSDSRATGPFPSERFLFHRLVPLAASRLEGFLTLPWDVLTAGARNDGTALGRYLYLRVVQRNGQLAWSSPWFF